MSARVTYLFERFMEKTATPGEREELMGHVLEPANQELIQQLVEEAWDKPSGRNYLSEEVQEKLLQRILPLQHRSFKLVWKKIAVAASVLLILGLGLYFILSTKQKATNNIAVNPVKDVSAPVSSKAVITLADGSKVYPDSAGNATLARQGNVKIIQQNNGQILYQTETGKPAGGLIYNTLENPRGSKAFSMMLADGSIVWLNAGSTVTYPVAFTGNERRITMSGEAYFEVAHDKFKPFIVSVNGMNVQALGTQFNINAYPDEATIATTLIEGSVRVNASTILKPDQQAQLKSGMIKVVSNVNVEEVMSWKDGLFHFESADLKTILRQFARWYDIEVIYEGEVGKEEYYTIMSRSNSLSNVLKSLQANHIKFRIDNKKLYIQSE